MQYAVRGVQLEVDGALRRKAPERKVSLNQVIVEELNEAAVGTRKREDFSDLVGKWAPEMALDRILTSGRQIDGGKWKWATPSKTTLP